MSATSRRPGRPVPRDQTFQSLLSGLAAGTDPAKVRQILQGPLHLQSPLRIGDVYLIVSPSRDDPTRIDVSLQNALTMNPPVLIWTVP